MTSNVPIEHQVKLCFSTVGENAKVEEKLQKFQWKPTETVKDYDGENHLYCLQGEKRNVKYKVGKI